MSFAISNHLYSVVCHVEYCIESEVADIVISNCRWLPFTFELSLLPKILLHVRHQPSSAFLKYDVSCITAYRNTCMCFATRYQDTRLNVLYGLNDRSVNEIICHGIPDARWTIFLITLVSPSVYIFIGMKLPCGLICRWSYVLCCFRSHSSLCFHHCM